MAHNHAAASVRRPILPGRRERGERWSASGVRLWIGGRSQLPEVVHRFLTRVVATLGGLLLVLGLASALPEPAEPPGLACVGDLRWTESCREVGPQTTHDAVAPEELSRRLTAAWDFGPDSELWRAGGIPYHQAQRARWLRHAELSTDMRGKVAASLATTLGTPQSYGAWQTADADPELVRTAESIEEDYRRRADAAWVAYRTELAAEHAEARSNQAAWQQPLRAAFRPLGMAWLALAGLLGLTRLTRWRAERPLEVRIGPHELVLDGTGIPTAALAQVEVRWGRLELGLRDGSRWVSRPLRPRNPGRLELLVMRSIRPKADYGEESLARTEVHRALQDVLSRVHG